MLIIPCPFCGPRDESEFAYCGPKFARRPEDAGAIESEEWVENLTVPPNPVGPVLEHWRHVRGCGAWVLIERDTMTHDMKPAE